ncbi:MAG: alpha/beta hydrolase fold domain-containing protein, partial [Solirubrobacteraceae bacterium]
MGRCPIMVPDIAFHDSWSIESRLLRTAARAGVYPAVRLAAVPRVFAVAPLRAAPLVDRLAGTARPPRGMARRRQTWDGFDGEWLQRSASSTAPRGRADGPTILYLHGGAFLIGGYRSHRRLVAAISAAADAAPVLSVGYRQLPRWPIAQSVADGVTALRHLITADVDPRKIVVAGDSAGGGLAISVCVAASAAGL